MAHGATCSEISKGSSKTKCEGKWVARVGDANSHGNATIKTGALKVIEGGKPIARIEEPSTCGGRISSGASRTVVGGPSSAQAPKGKVKKSGAGETKPQMPMNPMAMLGPAMAAMGGAGPMGALMGAAGSMMPMLSSLMKGGLGGILGMGMNQLAGAAAGALGQVMGAAGGGMGGLASLATSAMQMGMGQALSQITHAAGAAANDGGGGGPAGGMPFTAGPSFLEPSNASKIAALALLAKDAENQAHYDSAPVFDALLAHADANGGLARATPGLAYASLPNDPDVVARILERGLEPGDALGRTADASQGIVFGAGMPLQSNGLTLVVPSDRLLELGAVATGKPGLGATLALPAGAIDGPLPVGDFAVASALPRGFVEPIVASPDAEHGVGTTPPADLRPAGAA